MFLRKMGREPPGMTQGGHHATTPCVGTAWLLAAPGHGVGPPGPPLALPPTAASSLPTKHFHLVQTRVFAVLPREFQSPCSAHLLR